MPNWVGYRSIHSRETFFGINTRVAPLTGQIFVRHEAHFHVWKLVGVVLIPYAIRPWRKQRAGNAQESISYRKELRGVSFHE